MSRQPHATEAARDGCARDDSARDGGAVERNGSPRLATDYARTSARARRDDGAHPSFATPLTTHARKCVLGVRVEAGSARPAQHVGTHTPCLSASLSVALAGKRGGTHDGHTHDGTRPACTCPYGRDGAGEATADVGVSCAAALAERKPTVGEMMTRRSGARWGHDDTRGDWGGWSAAGHGARREERRGRMPHSSLWTSANGSLQCTASRFEMLD